MSNAFRRTLRVFPYLGILALSVLGLTILTSVFLRYGLSRPYFGAEDLATISLGVVVASAITFVGTTARHITIDIMPIPKNRVPRVAQAVFVRAINIFVGTIVAIALVRAARCGVSCGAVSPNLSLPMAPLLYFLALSYAVNVLFSLSKLLAGEGIGSRFPTEADEGGKKGPDGPQGHGQPGAGQF